ncbi:hypothetical protein IQ07DRAFT_651766 [Pyrenochaeta sp. DS3sAY3a]|nr:hypothetical protein IQ07DRAFT_651766 [Pyrenochaeta sp. DS3sAY3a]
MRVLPITLPGLELHVLKIEKGTMTLIFECFGKKSAEVTINETEFRELIEKFGVEENERTDQSIAFSKTRVFGFEANFAMGTGVAKFIFERDDGTVAECSLSCSGPLGGATVTVSAWTTTQSSLSSSTDTSIKEINLDVRPSTISLHTPASPTAENDFQPPAITVTPPANHGEVIAGPAGDARKGKKHIKGKKQVKRNTPQLATTPMMDVDQVDHVEEDPLSRRFLYMACVSEIHTPSSDVMVDTVLQIDRRHGTLQYGGIPGWNADKLPKRVIALNKMSRAFLARPFTRLVVTGFDEDMGREYYVLNEQVDQGPQAMWASDVDSFDMAAAGERALAVKDRSLIEKALAECVECAR